MEEQTSKKDFFAGNFLKAEDCKGGEVVEFLDEGEVTEIMTPEGKSKAVMNFQVLVDGKEKTFTPNRSNGDILLEAFGENWEGKKFKIELTKVRVFGKMKPSIIAVPLDPAPIVKVQKMAKRKFSDQPKPIEEWTAKEWETAYNLLNEKYDKLKNKMRQAINHISQAQTKLSEAVL